MTDQIPLVEVGATLIEARRRYIATGILNQAELDTLGVAGHYLHRLASVYPHIKLTYPSPEAANEPAEPASTPPQGNCPRCADPWAAHGEMGCSAADREDGPCGCLAVREFECCDHNAAWHAASPAGCLFAAAPGGGCPCKVMHHQIVAGEVPDAGGSPA